MEFIRLITDIVICVDRFADIGIQQLSSYYRLVHENLLRERPSMAGDITDRTLEILEMNDGILYKSLMHGDFDLIVKEFLKVLPCLVSLQDKEEKTKTKIIK